MLRWAQYSDASESQFGGQIWCVGVDVSTRLWNYLLVRDIWQKGGRESICCSSVFLSLCCKANCCFRQFLRMRLCASKRLSLMEILMSVTVNVYDACLTVFCWCTCNWSLVLSKFIPSLLLTCLFVCCLVFLSVLVCLCGCLRYVQKLYFLFY